MAVGYTWSNAMDITDRNPQGGFSVVGSGDQGPWVMTFTLTAGVLSGTPTCLCQAPWYPILPAQNLALSPLYPASVRINNAGNMALTWNNNLWFADMPSQKTFLPTFVKRVLPNVEYALVQSFNEDRDIMLTAGAMWSPSGSSGNSWMTSNYSLKGVGITLPTTQYKRFMNNNPDVLVGPGFDTPLHVLQSNGTKVDLTTYFKTPSTTPVYPTNATPVAINDNGQIVCLVQTSNSSVPVYNSVLLTPM